MKKLPKIRAKILYLLIAMTFLILLLFVAAETAYMSYYKRELESTAMTITRSGVNQLYAEINQMWHEISLISGTITRSGEVQRYVRREAELEDILPKISLAVNLVRIGAEKIESVIITDFTRPPLFAYGRRDALVLADARRMIGKGGGQIFSPTHFTAETPEGAVPYCVNYTDTPPEFPQVYVIIIYNISQITRVTETVDASYGTMLALFGSGDRLLLSNNSLAPKDYPQNLLGHAQYDIRTAHMEVRKLARMNWYLAAYLDDKILAGHMSNVVLFTQIINSLLAVTLVFFLIVLQQQINTPIRQIVKFMDQLRFNSKKTLRLRIHNELSIIAEGLNRMLDELNKITQENLDGLEKIYIAQLEQKRAENASLMNQINPHFLYNTLDSIRGIALSHSEKDIARMVDAIAFIMRYSVRGEGAATVREEMRSINKYMEIIHIRHAGRISMDDRTELEIGDCLIPKMILQPIVENAVFYGLEPVSRAGRIVIEGRMEDGFLLVVVTDNGKGMCTEEAEALKAVLRDTVPRWQSGDDGSSHIGLRNIHRRLRLLFDEKCGIEIESEENAGTSVTIRLYPGAAFNTKANLPG